jgi:radical SAM protein with 4Fe4S-binding SPASM domain
MRLAAAQLRDALSVRRAVLPHHAGGRLTPCPYLPEVAGDLRTQSVRGGLARLATARALRHGEPGGKCGSCEYRRVCGGCRARAFARTGDVLGPDDSCAYEPDGTVPVIVARGRRRYGAAIPAAMD